MIKEFYIELQDRIKAKVPEIKTFGLWANQYSNEEKRNPIAYPAVFVEFASNEWESQQTGIQASLTQIVLHIGVEVYTNNIDSYRIDSNMNLDFLDLVAKLHLHLHGFSGDFFNPLLRVSEQQYSEDSNLLVWEVTYSTRITDDKAEKRYSKPLVLKTTPNDLDLTTIYDKT